MSVGRAAALSLLFPGLGQASLGYRRRGFLLALPAVVAVAGVIGLLLVSRATALTLLLSPAVMSGLVVLLVGLFFFHAAAIVDAYLLARRKTAPTQSRAAALVPLALVLVLAATLYGTPTFLGIRAAANLGQLFPGGTQTGSISAPSWESSPSPSPTSVQLTPGPGSPSAPPATPSPTPAPTAAAFSGPEWARDGRLNVVLLGADEGPGRFSLRTDAIFLLSVDVATGRSAVFGFPRYMSNIPLPPASAANFENGRFPRFFNALYVYGLDHGDKLPDNDERGLGIVAGAVQELAGVRVDHYAMVNLNGFVDLVNAMGGLWIDVPEPGIIDDRYAHESGTRQMNLRIDPGCQLLNGTKALAFSRSRHQDSDYARLGRQTVTLAALRRQFDPVSVLPRLPELFDIAGDNVYWTLTPNDAATIAQLASKVDADKLERVLFIPPEYDRELPTDTVERIRDKVRGIFDEPAPEPTPSPSDGPSRCPPPG